MTDSFHVIYLTGAPATGKSTLVSWLMQSVQPLEGLSYSKLLSDYIAQQRSQLDLAQMRKLSALLITPEDIDAVDTQLIEYVRRRRQETHLIIDSHPVTKEAYGFRITAFSVEKLQALRPTMICMLYTEPGVVVERIQLKGFHLTNRGLPNALNSFMEACQDVARHRVLGDCNATRSAPNRARAFT